LIKRMPWLILSLFLCTLVWFDHIQ
jgi:hypothetical protein